jgi:hypothetical protein
MKVQIECRLDRLRKGSLRLNLYIIASTVWVVLREKRKGADDGIRREVASTQANVWNSSLFRYLKVGETPSRHNTVKDSLRADFLLESNIWTQFLRN